MNSTSLRSVLGLLLLACVALGAAIGWHQLNASRIGQAEQQLKARTWLSVLPSERYDNQPLQQPILLRAPVLAHSTLLGGYRATLQGHASAVVLHSQTQGYAGPLQLLVAIDRNGRLLATRILRQQETPGLGGKLVEPGNSWLQQFVGRASSDTSDAAWALKRDNGQFDQLAGASVTSRAVIQAVQDALRYFDAHAPYLLTGTGDE
ncbi:RnfABCDGE type electron transport complex subunit G [Pseudomonas sp. MAFF212428]|uniref:Ion-translocating oxidoreductase complex subunit G n=1 Tax=Pseudomonas brassicae TaxID=2708063 RepID=A0A6B3NRC3_9PSED|nr:RnfABCDGE type electron transport complex subunit G [Pseudomonas brassicae]NER62254.1 RnfABCDGE type electron transport complex subunit G [Pseudomonas brassicae]NER65932.1 RnfABCDGE type electron transport complex subunit G [Pseudomonas brassicae]